MFKTEKNKQAVISVDFELFKHTPAYRRASGTTRNLTAGIGAGSYLLRLFEDKDVTATFFVVSTAAEAYPETIRRFSEAGHEIGSHTHSHTLLTDLDAEARREELVHSRQVLREITGESVNGLRAPAFALPADYFGIVKKAGYSYDSSVNPSRAIPGWYDGEYSVQHPSLATDIQPSAPPIAEVPISVMPGLRLPLSGAWIRFFGRRYTRLGMELLSRKGITPVLYIHPWELVDLPAVDGVPERVYWRTGEWMRRTLENLLESSFEFVSIQAVLDSLQENPQDRDSNWTELSELERS